MATSLRLRTICLHLDSIDEVYNMDYQDIEALKTLTVHRIDNRIKELGLFHTQFVKLSGASWKYIQKFRTPLTFSILCEACQILGFRYVGDIWNPYPEEWEFLPISYERVCKNIHDNLLLYKKHLMTQSRSIIQVLSENGIARPTVFRLLKEVKNIQLDTALEIASAMRLSKFSYIYMYPKDFESILNEQ